MAPALHDYSRAGPTAHSPPTLSPASVTTCLTPSAQHKVAQQGERKSGETQSACCLVLIPDYRLIARVSCYLQGIFSLLPLQKVVVVRQRQRKAQSRARNVGIRVKSFIMGTCSSLDLLVLLSVQETCLSGAARTAFLSQCKWNLEQVLLV